MKDLRKEGGIHFESIILLQFDSYIQTGRYFCFYNISVNESASIYVSVNDLKQVLLPVDGTPFQIIELVEGQQSTIPCLPTISSAAVVLFYSVDSVRDLNSEESLCWTSFTPLQGFLYDPTDGFEIPHRPASGKLCCKAVFRGNAASIVFFLIYRGCRLEFIPILVPLNFGIFAVNSSFALTCDILASDSTADFQYGWSYPTPAEPRVNLFQDVQIYQELKAASLYKWKYLVAHRVLILHSAQASDEGFYRCTVVTTKYCAFTDQAFLHIDGSYMSHYLKEIGESVQFKVDLRIFRITSRRRWFRLQAEGEIKEIPEKYEILEGKYAHMLRIHDIQTTDSGIYYFETWSPRVRSCVYFRLSVSPGVPNLETQIAKKCCYAGATVYELSCGSDPFLMADKTWVWRPSYQMMGNNSITFEMIYEPGKYFPNMVSNKTEGEKREAHSIPVIKHIPGQYFCRGTNEFGSVEKSILDIKEDTSGTSNLPLVLRVPLLKMFSLTCSANKSLHKSLEVQMRPPGSKTFKTLNNSLVVSEDDHFLKKTLYFKMMTYKETGMYRCSAPYKESLLVSNEKFVFIFVVAPSTSKTNINVSELEAVEGKHLELLCYMNDVRNCKITWYHDGLPLMSTMPRVEFYDKFQKLVINRLKKSDGGFYECRAENDLGSISLNITLLIKKAPINSENHHTIAFSVLGVIILGIVLFLAICFFAKRSPKPKRLELTQRIVEESSSSSEEDFWNDHTYPEENILASTLISLHSQEVGTPYDKKLEFPKDRLKFGRHLGCGEFGRVVKAKAVGIYDFEPSTTVAVKMVKDQNSQIQRKAMMAELKFLMLLGRHVNIVNLLGAVTKYPKGGVMIILEYCHHGNLRRFLQKHKQRFIPDAEVCSNNVEVGDLAPDEGDYSRKAEDLEDLPEDGPNTSDFLNIAERGEQRAFSPETAEMKTQVTIDARTSH